MSKTPTPLEYSVKDRVPIIRRSILFLAIATIAFVVIALSSVTITPRGPRSGAPVASCLNKFKLTHYPPALRRAQRAELENIFLVTAGAVETTRPTLALRAARSFRATGAVIGGDDPTVEASSQDRCQRHG
ncbi:MAG: hypothetical protein H7Z14_13790 [Anaerolineae bacterium]|nr:hypothetical protein [Phycisphaerae bacterium]